MPKDSNRFVSKVAEGRTHEITNEDIDAMDIIQTGESHYHIIKDNINYNLELVDACYETKKFIIKVNGKKFHLSLEDEFDLMIQKLGLTKKGAKGVNNVKAPMPGMVLDILCNEGNEIVKGDSLIILEAMKMENIIKSPADGIVDKIEVKLNQAVNKNDILIKFK